MSEIVNILTRTSKRPNFFKECVESVNSQTYGNIRHIVCADDQESLAYAKKMIPDAFLVKKKPRLTKYGTMHAPYNLYCNELLSKVEEGWIMFLDDDDLFTSNKAIEKIMNFNPNNDDLLLWKVQFPYRVVPNASNFGKHIVCGDISGIGCMFHKDYIWAAQWDEVKASDYRMIQKLCMLVRRIMWIDGILTKINYQVRGVFGGLGLQQDKLL
jgi:glycosyltransferase involved in cell wall biosynthesis